MNKLEKKFNQNDYTPKRFGLKYNPPQIIIEYLVPSTGKLYHHKIRLGKFKPETNLQEVVKDVYEKHYIYLDNKKVNPAQIVKLVEKLSDKRKTSNDDKAKENNSSMSQGQGQSQSRNNQTNQNPNSVINEEINAKSSSPNKVDINELEDEEDADYYKFFDYENEDLNKLDNDELRKRKDQMEKLYEKNAIQPGDDNFVFDVRVSIENCYPSFFLLLLILIIFYFYF
jgi:hypothetical protein